MSTGRHDEFGQLLRTRRRAAGWTQQELAGRAGVSARSLSDLERGVRKPYPRTAVRLAKALGLDPDSRAELIAAVTPAGVPQPAVQPPARPSWVTPRQLPPVAAGFVGRAAELAALSELAGLSQRAGSAGDRRRTVVISAIGGTAGVGKTALAVRWAHQAAERFPDGQLYVNLRGYDGLLELRRGRLEQAGHHLHAALAMSRANGVRHSEAETLAALGELALRQGDGRHAADLGQQALALAREIGDRAVEAAALSVTSDALLAMGEPGHG